MLKNLLIISLFIFLICTSTKNVFAATMNLQVSTNADDAASFGTEFYVSGEDTNGSAYAGA